MQFYQFQKIARLSREIIITEKIDGTNAQICIGPDGEFLTGSRNRWITPDDDNFGFARWANENKAELLTLGEGRHYGEWWGYGIQRNYGKAGKSFSLFNVSRWAESRPACCDVVPTLYRGIFSQGAIDSALSELRESGSKASSGFMNPEGIVIYHVAANFFFKKTLTDDDAPKSISATRQQGEPHV